MSNQLAAKFEEGVNEEACLHSNQLPRQAWQSKQNLRENQASSKQPSTKNQNNARLIHTIE
jgi:hypothetical protein